MADVTSIYGNPIKDAVARADIATNTQDISDLKDGLSKQFDVFDGVEWVDGARLYGGTGAVTTASGWSYMKAPLSAKVGMVLLTTAARSPSASIVFYDENEAYILDYMQPGSSELIHTVYKTIPSGAAYVGVTCYSANKNIFRCQYLTQKSDDELNKMLTPLYNLGNNDLIYKEQTGLRLTTTGAPVSASGYVCTDFIPAKFGQYIICGVQPVAPVGAINVACYDASKTFIDYSSTRYVRVLPKGTAYIRICHQSDTLSTFKIKLISAEIRTAYDPIYLLVGTRLSSSGVFYNDIGYATSWFIDVTNTPYLSISFEDETNGHGAYFYDSDFTYISGSSTTIYPDHAKYGNLINVPANAKYMILTTDENFNGWSLSAICSGYRDVYIGAGRKYTSILQALTSERGSVRFFVDSGTYNVVNEYKAFYGNNFWDEYEGYSGKLDVQLRGYTPDYGQEMHFSAGAEVVFDYSGNNTKVFEQFSVFNLSLNNVIDGAKITFGDHIARYAIHDDMANGLGTNVIKNCIFNGTSYNEPVIGGGCGTKCNYYIEHCLFENNSGYADVMYHNGLAANALNHVHVRDCIGDRGVYFYYIGDSTLVSTFVVSNSKFPTIQVSGHPSYDHPNVNVRLVEYCNDKTPVN